MVQNGVNVPLVELINAGIEVNGQRLCSGITFNVTRGEFVCLHGPTGSGKSLALAMIAGIQRPTFGEVRVAGDCLNNFTEREMAIVRRSMGIMIQECLLLENRTILENVMLPALAAEESFNRTILENVMLPALAAEESFGKARTAALHALEKCGIPDLAHARPHDLSAGQKQIACVARAIVNNPLLVLADEPCAHLDADNAQHLMDLLGEVSLSNVSVIVASHLQLMPDNIVCRPIMLQGDMR